MRWTNNQRLGIISIYIQALRTLQIAALRSRMLICEIFFMRRLVSNYRYSRRQFQKFSKSNIWIFNSLLLNSVSILNERFFTHLRVNKSFWCLHCRELLFLTLTHLHPCSTLIWPEGVHSFCSIFNANFVRCYGDREWFTLTCGIESMCMETAYWKILSYTIGYVSNGMVKTKCVVNDMNHR